MSSAQQAEVDRNYDFFQRVLAGILPGREGQYALIRHEEIVDWFGKPGDAYRAGLAQFADQIFSIQEATDQPVEIGAVSIVLR